MATLISVTKADGTTEYYSREKLVRSIQRAGASSVIAEKIADHFEHGELRDGMPTREIFEHARLLLGKAQNRVAGRYSLKRAVANFGPSGFPFEKFVSELLRTQGFTTETNKVARGKCAEHELDVIAWNDKKLLLVEAKFHNELGIKSDLKVALYVKARFDDLRDVSLPWGTPRLSREMVLITNTKFSQNAVSFASCAGITLIGWNEPARGNLHDMIEEAELHPITSLSTLTPTEKLQLFERGVVLCKGVAENKHILSEIGLTVERQMAVQEEAERVCHAIISSD